MLAWMLTWLMMFVPAPDGTKFKVNDNEFTVVATVQMPGNECPRKITATNGREYGWAFRKEFEETGVSMLNVCLDQKDRVWLFTPYSVWKRVQP